MATITGLRLEQLSRLISAPTGNKLYTVSPSNNSYYITMYDFGRSIDSLFISGNYISSSDADNYVKLTDDQYVTGIKTFQSFLYAPAIYNWGPYLNGIDLNNGNLLANNGYIPTVDWVTMQLKDINENVALNWGQSTTSGRLLTGNWKAQSLTIPLSFDSINRRLVDSTNNTAFTWAAAGNTSTVDLSVEQHFYVDGKINTEETYLQNGSNIVLDFGQNQLLGNKWSISGAIMDKVYYGSETTPIIEFATKSLNDTDTVVSLLWNERYLVSSDEGYSLDWDNRILNDSTQMPSLDWNNKILSGVWYANILNFNNLSFYSDNYDAESSSYDFTLYNNGLDEPLLQYVGMGDRFDFHKSTYFRQGLYASGIYNLDAYKVIDIPTKTMIGSNWAITGRIAVTGTAPVTSTSAGKIGEIRLGGDFLYVATGESMWGRVQLLTF